MVDRHPVGVLDTCTYIDLDVLSPEDLPVTPELTAVMFAELQQGVAMARDAAVPLYTRNADDSKGLEGAVLVVAV